ncbi:MAG: hypothetical protein AB1529_08105 [Candidatus Micrarchaeota archaeon]
MEYLIPALVLGLKHSFDADHLLAVSNLLVKSKSLGETLRLSASWTLGHMGGAAIVTVLLYISKDSLLPFLFGQLETIVALMLVAFGLFGLAQAFTLHAHEHGHGKGAHTHAHSHLQGREKDHAHEHIFGIGIIQGLASNDELLMLLSVMLGLATLGDMVAGVAFFSIGVFMGMVAFGAAFTIPLLRSRRAALGRAVNGIIGILSVWWGLMMLAGS